MLYTYFYEQNIWGCQEGVTIGINSFESFENRRPPWMGCQRSKDRKIRNEKNLWQKKINQNISKIPLKNRPLTRFAQISRIPPPPWVSITAFTRRLNESQEKSDQSQRLLQSLEMTWFVTLGEHETIECCFKWREKNTMEGIQLLTQNTATHPSALYIQ